MWYAPLLNVHIDTSSTRKGADLHDIEHQMRAAEVRRASFVHALRLSSISSTLGKKLGRFQRFQKF